MATTRAEATPPDGIPALPTGYTPEPRPKGEFVEITPCVGGQTLRFTYYDAQLDPRLELTLDVGVPEPERDLFRRMMKAVGDRLPTLRRPVTPPGPRLLLGIFALASCDLPFQLPLLA